VRNSLHCPILQKGNVNKCTHRERAAKKRRRRRTFYNNKVNNNNNNNINNSANSYKAPPRFQKIEMGIFLP
jgi:hypothetical protein